MKIFYDIPYMKAIMLYVLVPVVVVLAIVGVCLYVYSKKHEDHSDLHYNFVMNFWSSLIGIVITCVILAIAVAFSITMTGRMREYNLVEEKIMIYYLLKYFIIIPIVFVIWYIVKLIKTIYYKPKKFPETLQSENAVVPSANVEKPVTVSVETPTPVVEQLPPMEESLKAEVKEFENKTVGEEKKSEPEVISVEENIK